MSLFWLKFGWQHGGNAARVNGGMLTPVVAALGVWNVDWALAQSSKSTARNEKNQ